MLHKFEDSLLDTSQLKQGFYQVGNKLFDKKLNAFVEASQSKLPVVWNFNHSVFKKQSQQPRLGLPLVDLYRQRAQQLRDSYDYLILAYSGGADSDNILKTFQKNKIHLDEVWCDWPSSLIEKSGYVINSSTAPENMPVEWFMVIKPELDLLATTNPEIKIHISDGFAGQSLEDAEDTMTVISVPTVYTSIKRYRYITKYVQQLHDQGHRVAIITGMEKVIPACNGNQYGFKFLDTADYFKTHAQRSEYRNVEYFYWTPDFPMIVTEQAHQVWDVLKQDPVGTQNILKLKGTDWRKRKKWFDRTIKKVCYPWWDFNKIQVDKTGIFANYQFDRLTQMFKQEKFYQSWASCTMNTVRTLDPTIAYNDGFSIRSDLKILENFHPLGVLPW